MKCTAGLSVPRAICGMIYPHSNPFLDKVNLNPWADFGQVRSAGVASCALWQRLMRST
jgi:hypothetical protein